MPSAITSSLKIKLEILLGTKLGNNLQGNKYFMPSAITWTSPKEYFFIIAIASTLKIKVEILLVTKHWYSIREYIFIPRANIPPNRYSLLEEIFLHSYN